MKTALLLLVVTLAEATIGVFVKLTGEAVPIYTLNFYGLLFAAMFLFPALSIRRKRIPRFPKNNIKDTMVIGVLIAAQISVFNIAMTLAPIANVVIFWSVAPFFVFIFSTLFLGEKPRRTYILIFLLAFAGIFIAKPLSGGYMAGNLIALADGAVYAAMVTYMRHEGKTETGNDIFWFMLTAAIILSPALALFGPGDLGRTVYYEGPGMHLPVILWPLGLGVISTGVAYFCISIVLKKIRANIYSLVDIIVSPIVASVLGYLVFSEVPSQNMIYGGALLLGSGFWLTWEMSRHDKIPAAHPAGSGS